MKRFFALLLMLSLAFSLAACAAQPPAQEPSQSTSPAQSAPAPAERPSPTETAPAASASEAEPQFLVAKAEYPVQAKISDGDEAWWNEYAARRERYRLDPGSLDGFLTAAMPVLLADAKGENRVCSPLNVYMALAMAAEISGGESRAQILKLLNADSLETLETRADTLWNSVYCDDGTAVSVLAGSLWMRDDAPCLKGTVQTLRDVYHASSYRGDMSDPRYTQALRDWLNEQTGGQLRDAADGVRLDPQTMLALTATIYFRAKWMDQFDAADTSPQVFHAPGGDIECDFLHKDWADFWVYRGRRFTAVQQSFESAGSMWFLLPDEGVTTEELLSDADAVAFLCSGDYEQCEWYYGKLALPKLDVTSDLELSGALKALGVTDLFDPARADVSSLFENVSGVALTEVQHAARLTMDEEGVTAAAFTMMGFGAGGPQLEMDFTLDRPFLFKLASEDATPLFVGIINQP